MSSFSKTMMQEAVFDLKSNKKINIPICSFLTIFAQSIWFSSALQAAQPPQALLGRSISVSWQEEREQRALPEADWRMVQIQRRDDIYISTAGRIFRREIGMNYRARKGRYMTGSEDRDISSGNANFQSSDLVITTTAQRGAAVRRVTVHFDVSFGSCQASVINGIAAGESSYVRRSIINGREIEIRSVQTSLISCKIVDGNILQ